MIGMLIVTHRGIGAELLAALNEIVGQQAYAQSIAIGATDDMGVCRDAIMTAIKDVNAGKGVVLFTDMFGGTPSNLALSAMPQTQALVLAGVNLPMLIKFTSVRATAPLLEAAREAEAAGRKYIQLISETIAPVDTKHA
jgi:PTS system mannose-specific IIA component